MSKKQLLKIVVKLAVKEYARRRLRGTSFAAAGRPYGYGEPPKRGLRGRVARLVARRLEKFLR
ncbi:hypothetical protein [Deinococcus pimensis]|uniref:hypothetical protein n=1 Tax=Deinococcus pimensis TaxID=309888 RepID=UPI000483857F|nr:hypothetical protein [Deinococcus pimensis]